MRTSGTACPITPKLLSAIPFTPATGPRLLARDADTRRRLAEALMEVARGSAGLSLHVLFPTDEDAEALRAAGMLERRGVQFHWRNPGYASFDDFLAQLAHDKRKKIRQERRRVNETGVTFRRVTGREATPAIGTSSIAAIDAPTPSTAPRPISTARSSECSGSAWATRCCS
jgi:predicted N-acyltransferase